MEALAQISVWLNAVGNAFGNVLSFITLMPGWLSATLIAIVSGVGMIIAFKWTSNQKAIKQARRDIRANLLTVKLFHDNMPAGFIAQGRVLEGAFRLLLLAFVPIIAMIVPMTLLLSQLALWYQARPLAVGEEAVIVLKLSGPEESQMPTVSLEPTSAAEDLFGPVRVYSKREVCWSVRAKEPGLHRLVFRVNGESVDKELAIGEGFLPVSLRRPEWNWSEILLHPRESPFHRDSAVQSIDVAYPSRSSWTSGTDKWVIFWFGVSLLTGFCCRGLFKVNL